MQAKINKREIDYKGQQLWLNPVDKTVYATDGAPTYSFGEVNGTPIYNYDSHFDAVKTAKDKLGTSYYHDAFVDPEFKSLAEDYVSDVKSGGRQRQAALRSSVNSAVDIVNVWETVLGKRDRVYAGKNLAKEIAVPNLLISIDTVTKFTGMEKNRRRHACSCKGITLYSCNIYSSQIRSKVHHPRRSKIEERA